MTITYENHCKKGCLRAWVQVILSSWSTTSILLSKSSASGAAKCSLVWLINLDQAFFILVFSWIMSTTSLSGLILYFFTYFSTSSDPTWSRITLIWSGLLSPLKKTGFWKIYIMLTLPAPLAHTPKTRCLKSTHSTYGSAAVPDLYSTGRPLAHCTTFQADSNPPTPSQPRKHSAFFCHIEYFGAWHPCA